MKPTVKKIIKPVAEEAEEFVKEIKRQVIGKEPRPEDERPLAVVPEETLDVEKMQQQAQQRDDQGLRDLRRQKAQLAPEWRQRYQQIQREELAAAEAREKETEDSHSSDGGRLNPPAGGGSHDSSEVGRQKQKPTPSGESALAGTGATKKRPSGLFGLGRGRKRFKWTGERKGQAPH